MRRPGVRIPAAPPIKSTVYGEALLAVFISGAKPLPKISKLLPLAVMTKVTDPFACVSPFPNSHSLLLSSFHAEGARLETKSRR